MRIAEVTVTGGTAGAWSTAVPGTERELPADLVLLAIGFEGTEEGPLLDQLGVDPRTAARSPCGPDWQTDADGRLRRR